jgi:putative ABC transport system ATP-binding protein
MANTTPTDIETTVSVLPTETEGLALRLRHVNKTYGTGDLKTKVLFDINLDLPSGELVMISGPSGCGKTTLISIVAGILQHDSGEINLFNTPIHQLSNAQKTEFRKQNVGFIFQQFNLLPTLTAQENVATPLLIQKMNRQQAFQRAANTLEQVGLGNRLDAYARELSGGQQQRVAIARALVLQPRLIVCDEPTASLDAKTGQTVLELLRAVAKQTGRCVLVVTHDNRIFHYADRMVEMEDGRITKVYSQVSN